MSAGSNERVLSEALAFVYVKPEPSAQDRQCEEHWRRVREAEHLLMVQTGQHEWTLVAHERVPIADQDPDVWGDQA